METINAEALLADRAYDTNDILDYCNQQDIDPVIPSKRNRQEQREDDRHLYRLKHLVENAFFTSETLARHRYTACKRCRFFCRCQSDPLFGTMDDHLVTTLFRAYPLKLKPANTMKKLYITLVTGFILIFFVDNAFRVEILNLYIFLHNLIRFFAGFVFLGIWVWYKDKLKFK